MNQTFKLNLLLILMLVFGQIGCSKDFIKDPLFLEKEKLTGVAGNPTKWLLAATKIDGNIQVSSVVDYKVQYFKNTVFEDSEGSKGGWKMPAKDSLVTSYVNFISKVVVEQAAHIDVLGENELVLEYMANNKKVKLFYVSNH